MAATSLGRKRTSLNRSVAFLGYFFFSSRVIHTKITAPTKETIIEHPATYDAPEDPENDVRDNSIAAALHHLAGKPPGNEPHNNPRKESHFGSSCSIVWEAPNASPI